MSASKAADLNKTHWFFLRGLGRESAHWGDFLTRFEEGVPGSRATALDLPGFGARQAQRSPATIAEIVDDVQEEFAQAQAGDPGRAPFLFAVSLGGMVAAEWLARSSAVSGAVLVNSSFRGWSSAFDRLKPEACGRIARIMAARTSLARERQVLGMVSNRPETHERIAGEWARIAEARPAGIENFLRQLLAAGRFSPNDEPPAAPILVLNSSTDRMVDSSCSLEISRRWRVPLKRHPSAGHDLSLDEPDWAIRQVADWLGRMVDETP